MLRKPAILFCGLLLAGVLALGIVRLFELRFDRGDVYPPYSTLRADPLGASVLYESLERVAGVSARRYFEKTLKEDDGKERALFVLGLRPYHNNLVPPAEFKTLQQFIFNGGRMVISYFPEVSKTWSSRQKEKELAEENQSPGKRSGIKKPDKKAGPGNQDEDKMSPKKNPDDDWREMTRLVDLREEWGFMPDFQNLATNEDGTVESATARRAADNASLPETISIHTALYFSSLTHGWTTVYQRDDLPVIVERKFGRGAVILVADSYCFSNEAMLKERHADLLAWMLGGGREAIFDEAHLGVAVDPGVAALMRKYRLHGLILSLLLLAALFIWKNSLSLVPPHEEAVTPGGAPVVAGKDSIAGFVNLLRRGIPQPDVLNACHEEWKKAFGRRASISSAQKQEVEQLVRQEQSRPSRQRNPVAAYRAISGVLRRKR